MNCKIISYSNFVSLKSSTGLIVRVEEFEKGKFEKGKGITVRGKTRDEVKGENG